MVPVQAQGLIQQQTPPGGIPLSCVISAKLKQHLDVLGSKLIGGLKILERLFGFVEVVIMDQPEVVMSFGVVGIEPHSVSEVGLSGGPVLSSHRLDALVVQRDGVFVPATTTHRKR